MADTTNPLPSITEPVIDRYRRWNPVWWRWIKPVLETVRSTAATAAATDVTVTTINTVVNGITGRVGLQINAGNRVVGMVLLEGTVLSSTFSVLADKFIIVHPTADGTTIQAFITGLVNGVSTIGINGNLIVDGTVIARNIAAGTITADKLTVSSLSAIAANVGTITAGILKSSDNKFVIDLNAKTLTIET